MNTAVVIVDVQNDFCAGGALAVPDAESILPVVNGLMRAFRRVFLTQDWHPPGHVSFASSHPAHRAVGPVSRAAGPRVLWPDHCVADTAGAALHPRLELPPDATVVQKGVRLESDAYSAFFENDHTTPVGLDDRLRAADVTGIVVAGLATDVCVLHTALDARRLGYAVTVVEAGCRGIGGPESLAAAWATMIAAGVRRG